MIGETTCIYPTSLDDSIFDYHQQHQLAKEVFFTKSAWGIFPAYYSYSILGLNKKIIIIKNRKKVTRKLCY